VPRGVEKDQVDGFPQSVFERLGALFLAGFVFYGVGFGLVTSVGGSPDFLSTISARHTTLVLGAVLMSLNSIVDVGKGVLFFPMLLGLGCVFLCSLLLRTRLVPDSCRSGA
jgi:hypothetical protein